MESLSEGQFFNMNQEQIVNWLVLGTLVYLSLMLESVGRFVLDIAFEQFAVEMIDQQNLMLYLRQQRDLRIIYDKFFEREYSLTQSLINN